MKTKSLIVLITVIFAFSGCHTVKKPIVLIDEIHSVILPFKITVDGSMSLVASGKASIERDKSVYMSVRFIGMEVFAIYSENDSIWIYDRTSGTLVADKLGKMPGSNLQLNQHLLQNLLLGQNLPDLPLDFNVGKGKASLIAADYEPTPWGESASCWSAIVEMKSQNIASEANMTWNFGAAEWNPEKLPQWKRPSKPKRTVKANDIIYLILSQL
ncbi:MAG: DUF4292 domain-containing protein [Muribaculaceae bacterium]|nr:DUF4292 domain-containing protein [Muribaculaceae bacterium]